MLEWRKQENEINGWWHPLRPYCIRQSWFGKKFVVRAFSGPRPRKAKFDDIKDAKAWTEHHLKSRIDAQEAWRMRGEPA